MTENHNFKPHFFREDAMKTIACNSKVFPAELPVLAEADVVVAGAGPGGLGAAVMAARCGASVVTVESYGLPGGLAATGEIHPFMISHSKGKSLDAPIYGEWIDAMHKYLPPEILKRDKEIKDYRNHLSRTVSKPLAALAAEDLLLEAGVKMLYHHTVCGVIMAGKIIRAIVVHSKSGFGAVVGRVFVDCTGDGDLAVLAGCRFEMGDDKDHLCQPMTLCFKLCNVKLPPKGLGNREWVQLIQKKYKEAQASGVIDCPREDVLMFPFEVDGDGVVHFNTTRVIRHDATNGLSLSEAEVIARRQLRQILAWLRAEIPGFENAALMSTGIQIGVRESRRICGIDRVTQEAFTRQLKFPDGVVRCSYQIDVHSPTGSGTWRESIPRDEFYEIPYGCIVPRDCDNLTVGGRPISSDMAIHSSFRVMPPAISIGQAAGVAAAMAVAGKTTPAKLDGVAVRRRLIELGARL